MKFLISICIISSIFLTKNTFAFNYKNGDTLNVFAVKGLNIRDSVGLKGNILATVDFRGHVIVVNNYNFSSNYYDSMNGLKGNWIKVKFGKITGYAFDGFLSSLPIPEIHEYDCEGQESPLVLILNIPIDYCAENLTQVSISQYVDFRTDENIHSFDLITYKKGIQMVKHYYWELQTNELILNNRRESEIINLAKMFAVFLDQDCFDDGSLIPMLFKEEDHSGTFHVLDWQGNMAFYIIRGGPQNHDYRLYFNYWH